MAKNNPGTRKSGNKTATGNTNPGEKVKGEKDEAGVVHKPKAANPKAKHKNSVNPASGLPAPTETNIQSPLIKTDMDVLHHPQLNHKPKPWKEYLIEGFMIFIAVMMGFIAENIREDIDNNEHAKQLTTQLVRDLRADTDQLNYIYANEGQVEKYNDTLLTVLQQPLNKIDMRRLQKLAANSHNMWPFHPSAGAMSAIKNELHLKQFSNSQIITYFSAYEGDVELLHTAQDVNLQYQHTYLDPFITQHFTPSNLVAAFSKSSVPNGQMRNLKQEDVDQLATDMVLIRVVTQEMIRDNVKLKKNAVDMLQYVTKQFNPDN